MRSHVRRHGATLVAVFIFAGAALIASCAKPYPRGNRALRVRGYEYQLAILEGSGSRVPGRGQNAGGEGGTDRSDDVRSARGGRIFPQDRGPEPRRNCLSAARPEIFQADIDKAVLAGIPVICVDADVPDSKRLVYIGTDNVKAGRESLKRMAALIPGKGNIVVISIPGQHNVDDRVAGVADALKNFPSLS